MSVHTQAVRYADLEPGLSFGTSGGNKRLG